MNCTACGFDNRDDALFCGDCGASLAPEIRCAGCGRISPAGRKFCDGCGHPFAGTAGPSPQTYTPKHLADKILRARSALEGERKQVTVFFADVKGSMELAEQVDAEEWHRILDRFFQILSEGVHRYEGTINQYTGDGVMALFGAPIAHEDHAQRACFAALYLRDALHRYADELRVASGLNFSVRMGLNSGEVVVGKIGDDLRMDYTAQGATVGLAARMEQLAEPGKVLLTQHTAALVTGYFRLRDLGPARIKGVTGPLRIHELEGVGELRTRFDLSRQRGFSRFVGRAEELRTLEEAMERALAGDFAVVGVVAEAGTGKSRLCHEFAQACRSRGIEVHQGHALPHGKLVPLLPLLELMRGIFGIGARDSSDAARQKIAGRIVLLAPELQDKLPLWFDLFGVPDASRPLPPLEPEVRQAQLMAGIRRLVRARSHNAPGLLLIEDLHWLDDASDVLLAGLVDVLQSSRTLLLLNFRPEYHAAWMERDGVPYRQIALRPLGAEAVNLLLDDLLGTDSGFADLRQLVSARTGGSPFFVEEVVRSLFDNGVLARDAAGTAVLARGIDEIEIPSTVQAVLAARIDRLPEAHKHVLQTAAVIGKTFSESMLRSALAADGADAAAALEALVGADFLHLETLAPEKEYAFRHPLTQEVAYRSQLGDRRAPVHAAVARAIEAAHAGQLDEQAALLAHHWAGAGELLRAAEWHRRAAEWLGMRDRREMMRHWRQVCDILADVPESPEALALGVVARQRMLVNGVFVGMPHEEVGRLFDEGIALAARLPHLMPQVSLRMSYGLTLFFGGAIRDGLAQMREVLEIADESQDNLLRYIARVSMLGALTNSGNLLESVQHCDEALEISGGDPELGAELTRFSPLGVLLANRAQAFLYLGRNQEAWPPLERAYEIGRARNDVELVSMSQVFRSLASSATGDAPGALYWARQAVETAESVDSAQLRVGAYGTLGQAQAVSGLYDEAIEATSLALDLMHQTGTGLFLESGRLSDRAEVWLRLGDLAKARVDLERALSIAREGGGGLALIQALTVQAQLLGAEGDDAAAEAALDEAEALVARSAAIALQPPIHLERAMLALRRGDDAARRRQLQAAHTLLTAMGAAGRAAQIEDELGTSA